jgi:hypothetical protein
VANLRIFVRPVASALIAASEPRFVITHKAARTYSARGSFIESEGFHLSGMLPA